jgi:porin
MLRDRATFRREFLTREPKRKPDMQAHDRPSRTAVHEPAAALLRWTCITVIVVLAALLAARAAPAGEAAVATGLLGDPGGLRARAAAAGLDVQGSMTLDVLDNARGGLHRGVSPLYTLDLLGELDTKRAGWWEHGRFHVYLLGTAGDSLSKRSGDMQFASNIEGGSTFTVLEAWYEHKFLEDRLSWLVGLHDLNTEFYMPQYGQLFVNSSLGLGIDMSQVGVSTFPATSFGARLAFAPTATTYVMAGLYDGVPGDPAHPYGTQVVFGKGDGLFGIGEVGIHSAENGPYYKLALGGWYHTRRFDDYTGRTRNENSGIYGLAERELWRDAESGRSVGSFVQLGTAEGDRNQTGIYLGAGLNVTGLLPARPSDVFGVGIAQARNSGRFLDANPPQREAETALEFTYQLAPTSWLTVQPDLQYIVDPSTDPAIDDAVVVGMRFLITL